ncbi:penicillin-binding protein 1B [Moraxella caviae]|uniref:Penicillin-binding protein 1B n=1 Tax=Moraxella caviae TaxID=34060 RepID=A0A1S9ZXD3_9GAMM|nr:penicillin-binding protein 1B [Moraxella caviae]OOR88057.1 penicillin-binding protein 1B [Moraxella caviae]STZ10006.1 Murein polymerase [Moraxella caviae]VEW12943.1 Murein polymerase [Moraxella caviae]
MNPIHRRHAHQRGFVVAFILWIVVITLLVLAALYVYFLNNTIINKFENRKWDIPATVYSRPLTMSVGAPIDANDLTAWLNLLNYDKISANKAQKSIKQGSYYQSGDTFTIYTRGFNYGDGDNEARQIIKVHFTDNHIARLQSSEPNTSGIVRLEPVKIGGIYPENNEDRLLLTAGNVPRPLVDALIATEDRAFYEHFGVSIRGTARALLANATGKSTQGGSTITQQLIKNFYLSQERTLKRKANEAVMAILLEQRYSKNDILLAYLNEINLGQNGNRSVNGFGIAAQFYFNKPLSELRLDQHALLVGIAKGPSYYNPRKHAERAKNRRDTVLHNMLVTGKISQSDYEKAISMPLDVVKTPTIAKPRFPDFMDVLHRELKSYYRTEDLQNAGLRIISTLDPLAQTAADKAVEVELGKLNRGRKTKLESALVSADPHTGELVAIVGSGGDFTGFNRAVDAKRQVGSLLKPVIYLTALQSGRYQLTTPVDDSPTTYQVGANTWTPKNYNGISHGDVPLINALANSYNQAAVNVGMEFGLDTFAHQLRTFGIKDDITPYPSVLLGAVDLSPMDVLGMYQLFATGGKHTPIHSIKRVIDEKGKVVQRSEPRTQTRLSPEAAYLTNYALQSVIAYGTARSANFDPDLHLAGKTGTTNDNKDAWFAGFSGNYVSVVWLGRDDNAPIGLTGGSGALPIWTNYMRRLTLSAVQLPTPEGVTWTWLNASTGQASADGCPNARWLPVITRFAPRSQDDCAAYTAYAQSLDERAVLLGEQLVDTGEDFGDGVVFYEEYEYSDDENFAPNPPANHPNDTPDTDDPFYP